MKGRKEQSLQTSAAILIFSAVIVKLIGALFKIPLASNVCLGDLGFGYFSSAYDLFTPIYSLAIAGLPIAVAKMVSEYVVLGETGNARNIFKTSKRVYFILGLIGFLLMLGFVLAFGMLTNSGLNGVLSLLMITPSVFFCSYMSSWRGHYEGVRNMYPTAVSEIIEALCKLILGFGFAFITVKVTNNVAYCAAAAILGITVGTAVSTLYLKLYHKFKGDGLGEASPEIGEFDNKAAAKTLILLAIPVALASLSNNIVLIVDALTVKLQLASALETAPEVIREMYAASIEEYNLSADAITNAELPTFLYGIRGKAYTLYNLVPTFTALIGVSAVPIIAGLKAKGEKEELNKNIASVLKLSALISFPAGIGLFAASSNIMEFLYDTKASALIGGPILAVFGLSALFSGLAIPLTSVLQSLGKQKSALVNILIGAVIKIALGAVLVSNPKINILGAALGTLACYFIIFLLDFICVLREVKISSNIINSLLKPFVSALVCGVCAFFICKLGSSSIVTVLAIFAAILVYFALLVLLNTFSESDFLGLPKGEKIAEICKKLKIIRKNT